MVGNVGRVFGKRRWLRVSTRRRVDDGCEAAVVRSVSFLAKLCRDKLRVRAAFAETCSPAQDGRRGGEEDAMLLGPGSGRLRRGEKGLDGWLSRHEGAGGGGGAADTQAGSSAGGKPKERTSDELCGSVVDRGS